MGLTPACGAEQTLEGLIRGGSGCLYGGAGRGGAKAVCSFAGITCLVIVSPRGGREEARRVLAKERTLLCPHLHDLFSA